MGETQTTCAGARCKGCGELIPIFECGRPLIDRATLLLPAEEEKLAEMHRLAVAGEMICPGCGEDLNGSRGPVACEPPAEGEPLWGSVDTEQVGV